MVDLEKPSFCMIAGQINSNPSGTLPAYLNGTSTP
jgi:hypothetical protein